MSDSTRERLLPSSHNTQPTAFAALKERTSCILAGGQAEVKATSQVKNKFIAALCFSFLFMIVEVVGGYLANSLAIMTDAAHLLSDVGGFAVAIFAAQYASKRSQQSHTFGYHRVEVLAALASVLCSWAVTGILVAEAVHRIINPTPVNGKLMFFLALAGIAINVLNLLILGGHHHHGVGGHDHDHGHSHAGDAHSHGHSHGDAGHSHGSGGHSHDHSGEGHDEGNINLRGAVIHVLGDFVQSIGVAVAGALIWWKQGDPRWELADPICTFFFAILVLLTTKAILRDIWDILMERVPRQIDIDKLQQGMLAIDGVAEVHDLHVWLIKPGMPILAAHITSTEVSNANAVLGSVTQYCRSFGIDHSTIQVSDTDCPCIKQPEPSSHDICHHDHEHNQHQHDRGDSHHSHSQHGHDHSQHAHGDSQHSHVHHHQHPTGHEHGHSHNGEADHNHSHSSSDMV